MKKIFVLLSFFAVLNSFSIPVFADDDGYRHSHRLGHYYRPNDRYYIQEHYYYPRSQGIYYYNPRQSYYYQLPYQNRNYYHQRSRDGFLGRCAQKRFRH